MGISSYVWLLEALDLQGTELFFLSYGIWPRVVFYFLLPCSWFCTISDFTDSLLLWWFYRLTHSTDWETCFTIYHSFGNSIGLRYVVRAYSVSLQFWECLLSCLNIHKAVIIHASNGHLVSFSPHSNNLSSRIYLFFFSFFSIKWCNAGILDFWRKRNLRSHRRVGMDL